MKLTITVENFPMPLATRFNDELRKYTEVELSFSGKGTAHVRMDSDDIVKVQEICIVCDKYAKAGDPDVLREFGV